MEILKELWRELRLAVTPEKLSVHTNRDGEHFLIGSKVIDGELAQTRKDQISEAEAIDWRLKLDPVKGGITK